MVRAHTSSTKTAARESLRVCPFCGVMNDKPGRPCPRCMLEDTPATRSATKVRIGPWYVLQSRNPAAPGMKFQTLQLLIRKGFVTPQSVVRSPTTNQLWQSAAKVKGLSREFGLCYSCGGEMSSAETVCPTCNRSQALPSEVDALLELPGPATIEEAAPIGETAEEVVAKDHDGEAEDVLSPRELAMVFQLGYDPPGTAVAVPVIEVEPSKYYYAATAAILLIVAIVGVAVWWGHSATPRKLVLETPAATPAVVPQVHLEAVVVPARAEVTAEKKSDAPGAGAISSDDVPGIWNKALEAESHRDFKTAVKLYQSIQAMPSEVWPAGLPTRIKLARQELATGTY